MSAGELDRRTRERRKAAGVPTLRDRLVGALWLLLRLGSLATLGLTGWIVWDAPGLGLPMRVVVCAVLALIAVMAVATWTEDGWTS